MSTLQIPAAPAADARPAAAPWSPFLEPQTLMHRIIERRRMALRIAGWGAALLLLAQAAFAQPATAQTASAEQPLPLTLNEAIQIALVNNYTLQQAQLDVANAEAQVAEAWGSLYPQVDLSSSYTRNLKSPNPFAGSDAEGLFATFGFIGWLADNERARTDDDPATNPISYDEFMDRAGPIVEEGGNPFNVPNQFQNGITVEQTLFSGQAFAAVRGAERLKELNRLGATRQEQILIDDVRAAYYAALLAEESARVQALSVERTQTRVGEIGRQVAQGVVPKVQRLSAEVELANLQTTLVQTQNEAASALDNLKLTLGIPVDRPLTLRSRLEADGFDYITISQEDAVAAAFLNRPDLAQAQLAVELRGIEKNMARAEYYPTVSAFFNANYSGQVPGDRGDNGFFSPNYWNPGMSVGLRLQWNLFNGFQTRARLQQREVAIARARVEQEQLTQSVVFEVEQALRDLEAARSRINAQEQNVSRAELNYEYASARLREGVAPEYEAREASQQLDVARLNYNQALFDYLVAKSAFETAIGQPLFPESTPDPLTLR